MDSWYIYGLGLERSGLGLGAFKLQGLQGSRSLRVYRVEENSHFENCLGATFLEEKSEHVLGHVYKQHVLAIQTLSGHHCQCNASVAARRLQQTCRLLRGLCVSQLSQKHQRGRAIAAVIGHTCLTQVNFRRGASTTVPPGLQVQTCF